ncbi:MAG: 50S ribosomal protein L4 [Holosporales bacterium]|jgi:large subunit ribosomal protein L4
MQLNVQNPEGSVVGALDVDAAVFGREEIRTDILARVVQWQRDKRRAGTHKTKGISDISGTTKKPFKQKGRGGARHGSLRSPQFRGGARIFGPVVRDHGYSLNKKIRRLGLCMALSSKLKDGTLVILDSLPDVSKTKDAAAVLQKLQLSHALIVNRDIDHPFLRAVANIPNVDILAAAGANVYSILRRKKLVLTKEAAVALNERLAS